ncbi:UNVERIFIED_CONTAM: hypothetical protein LK11_45720 [Mumia flava]
MVALAVVAGAAVFLLRSEHSPIVLSERCTVDVGDTYAQLDLEQAEHATLMAAIAARRGLPARAVTIAVATAYQESKLRNIDYGDRDSLGLFQQRPSQGWGSPEQIMRPRYAINRFYAALEQVDGYRAMNVTEAAQAVQRSAYPGAYADHEAYGRAVASAATGNSANALTCRIRVPEAGSDELRPSGLTATAAGVRKDVRSAFGRVPQGGYAPGGISTGHSAGSKHYDGKAIDYFFRPVTETSQVAGWTLAHYLVANASRLGVATVIYDGRIWTARRSAQGWREYAVPDRDGDPDVLAHRDHVHVDVV